MAARLGHRSSRSAQRVSHSRRTADLCRVLPDDPPHAPSVKTAVQSSPYVQTHTSSRVVNFGVGHPSASLLLSLTALRDAALDRFTQRQDPLMLQYGAAKGFVGFREQIAQLVAGTIQEIARSLARSLSVSDCLCSLCVDT